MKQVLKQTLIEGDFSLWPTIALIMFSLVMAGVILWVLRPGSKEYYEKISLKMIHGD